MSALQELLDSFEKDEFDEDAWNYYGRVDPAEAEMEYSKLKAERNSLKNVARLAEETNSLLNSVMIWMEEEGIQIPFIMSLLVGSLGKKSRELDAALKLDTKN